MVKSDIHKNKKTFHPLLTISCGCGIMVTQGRGRK